MRGVRATKHSSIGVDSFESPNFPPLLLFSDKFEIRNDLIKTLSAEQRQKKFFVHQKVVENIQLIHLYPFMSEKLIVNQLNETGIQGIVLQAYGSGNIPTNKPLFLKAIRENIEKGVLVVNMSQCFHSVVDAVYETGLVLQKLGVVFAIDMTLESVLSKMIYLLSLEISIEEKKKLFVEDLRGELTPYEINQLHL